ncbi:MAG TPA: cytochrome b/b6 domain-containing protein, partial [Desulfobacteria bacterium]|nr:cytochrome b/b6 domain-containing protein [Desulfobacteria bacterium]
MVRPEDHPRYARISHWINLVCFAVLIVTGFIILAPHQGNSINLVRNLHFV